MRPAGRQSSVAISETPKQTSNGSLRIVIPEPLDQVGRVPPESTQLGPPADPQDEHRRRLAVVIRHRIETRLAGRVRDLEVHVHGETIILEGRCATYYTKQLAQHAALGVIDNEQLENTIVVMM